MTRPAKILITGGGAPGIAGTIFALRNNPACQNVKIVACDMRDDVIGKYLADEFYVIPHADDPHFVEKLLLISINANVDVILPQVTRELPILADNVHKFESYGIRIAISERQSIEKANDKWIILKTARACGLPYPESKLTRSEYEFLEAIKYLGYPEKKVVVKPRMSNGLRGVRIISEEIWDVKRFLREKPGSLEIRLDDLLNILKNGQWPELIVQEFLPGDEYTVDVFRGRQGAVAVPRLRKETRNGITFQALVDLRPDLQSFSLRLAEELDLRYAFGFQFKLSCEGIPKLLECNPRVQGTMVTSMFCGCNVICWAVEEALGKKVFPCQPMRSADGLRFIRYWGGLAIYGDKKKAGPI